MRICIREDLPVEPGDSRCINIRCPLLDIAISRARGNWASSVAVIVLGVGVAYTPLLHDELLASLLCLINEWLKSGGCKVGDTVGVDSKDVETIAGEICIEERVV